MPRRRSACREARSTAGWSDTDSNVPKRRRRMRWESQLVLLTLAGGLPGLVLATIHLTHVDMDPSLRGLVLALLWLLWLLLAGIAVEGVGRPVGAGCRVAACRQAG